MISTNDSLRRATGRPVAIRVRGPRSAGLAPIRKAFATVTAVVLLALAATTLAALAALFSADYRRTRDARTDAQLRQLLIAGAGDVSEKARAWPEKPPEARWDVAVPESLAGNGARVTNEVAGDNQTVEVHVTADYLGRTAKQTLSYRRGNDRWTLTDASLDQTPR
ncbi:MAG: hypothetical protein JWM97_1199 [Phycisphaerales bacterium]|nr:hypothetical protein [Phycisphaerales bacterium]